MSAQTRATAVGALAALLLIPDGGVRAAPSVASPNPAEDAFAGAFFSVPELLGVASDQTTMVGVGTDAGTGHIDILSGREWHRGQESTVDPRSFARGRTGIWASGTRTFSPFSGSVVRMLDERGVVRSEFELPLNYARVAQLSDGTLGFAGWRGDDPDMGVPYYVRTDARGSILTETQQRDFILDIEGDQDGTLLAVVRDALDVDHLRQLTPEGRTVSDTPLDANVRDIVIGPTGEIRGLADGSVVTIERASGRVREAWPVAGRSPRNWRGTAIDMTSNGSVRVLTSARVGFTVDEYDDQGTREWRVWWLRVGAALYLSDLRSTQR